MKVISKQNDQIKKMKYIIKELMTNKEAFSNLSQKSQGIIECFIEKEKDRSKSIKVVSTGNIIEVKKDNINNTENKGDKEKVENKEESNIKINKHNEERGDIIKKENRKENPKENTTGNNKQTEKNLNCDIAKNANIKEGNFQSFDILLSGESHPLEKIKK